MVLTPEKPFLIPVDTSEPWVKGDVEESAIGNKDARTHALERLREYICSYRFFRTTTESFQIAKENFYIDGIDSEDTFEMPAIAVISGVESRQGPWVPHPIESTKDVFKRGFTLVRYAEHVETFDLEVWAGTRVERRTIVAAMDSIFNPVQQMAGLRLILPNYFYQPARFTYLQNERHSEDGAKNRWRSLLQISLETNIVRLVPTVELNVMIGISDDE